AGAWRAVSSGKHCVRVWPCAPEKLSRNRASLEQRECAARRGACSRARRGRGSFEDRAVSIEFRSLIAKVATGAALAREEAAAAFAQMMSGEATPSQMGGLL